MQIPRGCVTVALELKSNSFNHQPVSNVEQMELELRKLSQAELRQIREWLDDFIEDKLEFTPEFENSIQQAERDMAGGKSARVREREGLRARRLRFTTQVSKRSFQSCHLLFVREL